MGSRTRLSLEPLSSSSDERAARLKCEQARWKASLTNPAERERYESAAKQFTQRVLDNSFGYARAVVRLSRVGETSFQPAYWHTTIAH